MGPGTWDTSTPPTDGYDPFVRGRLPVGVRTFQALDSSRERLFPCGLWYPAAVRHAGQDVSPQTRDSFTIASLGTRLGQDAVRDAASRPGAVLRRDS